MVSKNYEDRIEKNFVDIYYLLILDNKCHLAAKFDNKMSTI